MVETKRSIVEQIHHEFNTASDNALAEATAILSGVSNNSHLFTLHELGFKNAKGVQSYISSNGTINDYKRMCGIITSYQYQYPNYKFITESDVERICKKYKLGCAPVECYKGEVPAKNVKDISNFIDRYGDRISYEVLTEINYRYERLEDSNISQFRTEWLWKLNQRKISDKQSLRSALSKYGVTADFKTDIVRFNQELHICAPKRDLNLKGLKKFGNIFSRVNIIKETYEDKKILALLFLIVLKL